MIVSETFTPVMQTVMYRPFGFLFSNMYRDGFATFENSRLMERLVSTGLILTFLPVSYFFWVILEFPVAVLAVTLVWFIAVVGVNLRPYMPRRVRFEPTRLTVTYRKGTRTASYLDIVVVRWTKDFAGGGLSFHLKNGDEVVLGSIDRRLFQEVLRKICEERPDLLFGTTQDAVLGTRWGSLEDLEHKGQGERYWNEGWRKSFAYEYLYWGKRPKKMQ